MNETIIIEVECVNTCFGCMAKFWCGDSPIEQVGMKKVLDAMNSITLRYNALNKAVLFAVK